MKPIFTTADLWDAHENLFTCVAPIFRHFGCKENFSGTIITLQSFEDNSLVRHQLENDGAGKVLVIDGGGSLRCALVGDQLAALAIENNWEGIIINGCIRDSKMINAMNIGIKALATNPVKSIKRNQGIFNIPIQFGETTFIPGHYLYADSDGILISKNDVLL